MTKLAPTLTIFLILLFSYCSAQDTTWGREATRQEEKKAFKNATFDNKVFQNINKYNALKDFLLDNWDTIINYRNSKNEVKFIGAKSHVDSIRQVNEPCWDFTVTYGPIDISHVPNFLYSKLKSLVDDLGKDMLNNFRICTDKTLTFNIRYTADYRKNNLNVLHQLTWNKMGYGTVDYDFVKDKLLQDKWTYSICVYKDQGW